MAKVTITKKKDGTVTYSTGGGFMGNLLSAVNRGFRAITGRGKNGGITSWLGKREVIPEYDQDKAINEGFNASTWIYAIIAKNAKKFASVPRYLYDEKALMQEKGARMKLRTKALNTTQLFDSDLNTLLNRPNEYQGRAQFMALLYAFFLATAEGFIWLNRGDVKERYDSVTGQLIPRSDKELDAMPVLEMYVLPSNYMKVISDPDNVFGITGYCLEVAGVKIEIRKNDIIHWRDLNLKFDPTSGTHLRGMTRLTPGNKTVQENKDIVKSSVRMYQNDGAKGILFAPEAGIDSVTPQQESDIRTVVNAKINENDIKGAVALLMGYKWEYIDLAVNAIDLSLIEGRTKNQQELCALFDTPHLLFIPTEATLANLESAKRNWVNDVIIPASKELDDMLNLRLLKAFNLVGKAKIISDFTELPELQEDMNKLVDTLLKAYWVTPNQKLIAQGYEASENPLFDEAWIPSGLQPLSQVTESMQGDGYKEQLEALKKRGITA
jgi:phage portal protein BeeE